MTPKQLVDGIISSVLRENFTHYRETLRSQQSAPPTANLVPEWQAGVAIFSKLAKEDQALFLRFTRMVAKETISSVLAILDGVVFLEGQELPLALRHGDDLISGDLQDLFLEEMENDDAQ